jgi:hypothetical protein
MKIKDELLILEWVLVAAIWIVLFTDGHKINEITPLFLLVVSLWVFVFGLSIGWSKNDSL